MDINNITIAQAKEIASIFGGKTDNLVSAYEIGKNYMLRTVTHIVTGRLLSIHADGLRLADAAWVADTGRYAQAVASGEFNEVEPYPDGSVVIVNHSAMIDAVEIPKLPRSQK